MSRAPIPVLCVLFAAACGGGNDPLPEVALSDNAYDPAPQVPAILRDVAAVDDDVNFTRPYVPGHRTTMDGRVALRVQGGTEDIDRLSTDLSFFLFVPERLQDPILTGAAGPEILADTEPFDVSFPPAFDSEVFRLGHHTICDPTTEFPTAGERPNPYVCGDDTLSDCYDLVIISSTSDGLDTQVWGTPVTVEVDDPKTAQARIHDITMGEPVAGAFIQTSPEWTEPAVTMDGRLMTGRIGRFPREWTNPNTGETLTRFYDLVYSVLPESSAPCDVTGWTDFHPMSHAPYDPQMVGTYGLAAYPFRDTEGALIPDGEDVGGTYPWVDREGANVVMTGVHGRISEQSEEAYPRRCVVPGCEELNESVDFDRGFQIAGLWTHGKFVHLDGMINHVDWAVGVSPEAHWNVDLYKDESGQAVPIRLGGGRFIEEYRNAGPYPAGYTHNANVLDSLQNLPNFKDEAKPITPRDVVWLMSSGVQTDEISFDDLLDPNALIVSNMQASVTQLYNEDGISLSIPKHNNGQVRFLEGLGGGVLGVVTLRPDEQEDIHLQNGATTLLWKVPAYGRVAEGEGRTEPVAMGGVEGRGFWLSGNAAVTYAMPAQPQVDQVNGYVGLFVDPRTPDGEPRELLRFPDGTGVVLDGQTRLQYVRGSRVLREVTLPPSDGFVHLGWRVAAGHRELVLEHDGFPLDRFVSASPLFSFEGGDLVIGRSSRDWTGVRGWIDNFVVFAHDMNPELSCNQAMGTLVDVGDSAHWKDVAGRYPDWAHARVAAAASSIASQFACVTDHTVDQGATLANIPEGTVSIRDAIHFPEGPLQAGVPRPDSSQNEFCLSCHHDAGKGGLTVDALVLDPQTLAEDDVRRQPTQPPRRVFGNIPAGWIAPGAGPGSPVEATQAPAEGALIDHWVLQKGG